MLELSADLVTLCTVNAWGMLHNSYRVNALDAWRELNGKQTKRTEGERRELEIRSIRRTIALLFGADPNEIANVV